MAHVNEAPPPLRQTNPNVQVSANLEETIARCLAKEADQRFRSMDEVLAALKRIGSGAFSQTFNGTASEFHSLASSGQRALSPGNDGGSGPSAQLPTVSPGYSGVPAPVATPRRAPRFRCRRRRPRAAARGAS